MPAKKKPAAKKEEEEVKKEEKEAESSSSSSDSDSSSSDEAPAPKKKVSAKGKAKAKAKEVEAAEKKAEESGSDSGSDSDSDSDSDEDKGKKEVEVAKPVFVPPPRPVFTPHDKMADMKGPQDLEYCPNCGLPPDFCQHGGTWDKCKPWCMEKYPHYYPELSGVSLEDAKKKAEEASNKKGAKQLPGGKTKREASPGVEIKKMSRGGRKCVTSVAGLEAFGVKLDEVAKLFKKKFSCGASVVKGDHGLPDTVDIQGDFEQEVIDILADQFKVPKKKVTLTDGGTKKKGKGGAGGRPEASK